MARSNRLLIVGVLVTLLGVALVLAILSFQRSADAPAAAPPPTAPVTSEPSRIVATQAEDVTTFEIPDGTAAVAVTVDFQRSVAALPRSGDRVDVYGRGDAPADASPLERLLADVEVLTVTGAAHDANSGAPTVVLAVPDGDVAAVLGSHLTDPVYLTLLGRGTSGDGASGDPPADDVAAGPGAAS